jgi:hypothetical protein
VVTPSTPIGRARATKRTRRIVAISLGLWALFLAGYITLLMIGHTLGDLGCEYPAGSSNYGTASWQWWPPGTRCAYSAHHVDRPSWASGTAVVVLIGWPAATWFVARRR